MSKILIVDDAAFMRKMLSGVLSQYGYEIAGEACDGRDAYKKYKELRPDLVTMDITMPEVNGIEAVHNIVSDFPDAKIIMCSAMGQKTMVLDAIKAGAKDFIVKPFQPDKVAEVVLKTLQAK